MKSKAHIAFAMALVALCDAAAAGENYEFALLGGENTQSSVAGTSHHGVAAGRIFTKSQSKAVTWNNGIMTVLMPDEKSDSSAVATNDVGQAVVTTWQKKQPIQFLRIDSDGSQTVLFTEHDGWGAEITSITDSGKAVGLVHRQERRYNILAVVWNNSKGVVLRIPYRKEPFAAVAANDHGLIVGYASPPVRYYQAMAWIDRRPHLLPDGHGGRGMAYATAVNTNGVITGVAGPDEANLHAVIWRLGQLTHLDEADRCQPLSINALEAVVGSCAKLEGHRATYWADGQKIDLNSKIDAKSRADGWVLESAVGVSDEGLIYGNAKNNLTGEVRAFSLRPI